MRRYIISILLAVIGLTAFSQSPSRSIYLQPAYPLTIGESTVGGTTVSSNGIYVYDVPTDSLPRYEIGQIFTQTVRYTEDGMGFYIKADSLHSSNIEYSYEIESPPLGTIELNENTGRFRFYPSVDDYRSFTIKFIASNGETTVSEDVLFNLMPPVASETYAIQSQGTMPTTSDYIYITETSTTKKLNNENRSAYSINIAGKEIVFDNSVQNKVWGLSGREDIYELNIFAERLVIKSALRFPQTNVTIHARELVFEDSKSESSYINTTPSPISVLTDGKGANGENAGNINLYVKDLKTNIGIRFIANGAKGQDCNRNGQPDNGGNGGIITSTIDVGCYSDFVRGSCGAKYDFSSGEAIETASIMSFGDVGSEGKAEVVNKPYSYLHPYYISPVILHAKDAFISNHQDYALQVCQDYRNLIDEYMQSEEWDNCSAENEMELKDDLTEIDEMLLKLEQGLDYFGNPSGWVPLLSFEVMLSNYENEIERAIPTLYMYYWLNRIDQTLQNKMIACQRQADLTEKEIQQNQDLLNSLIQEIPELQDQADEVMILIKDMTAKVELVQAQLLSKAKHNVKKKKRIDNAFGILKAVVNVIPVVGPFGSSASSAVNSFLSSDFVNKAAGFLGVDYSSALQSVGDVALDNDFFKNVKESLSNFMNSLSNMSGVEKAYKSLYETVKPLTTNIQNLNKFMTANAAPNSEIQSEFERLKAESVVLQSMTSELNELNQKKEELLAHLNTVMCNMKSTISELSNDAVALDALKRDVFSGNGKRDLNAMLYFEKMQQRAKSRLLKYDYYLRKAYEYRLLKPYDGEEFNLLNMFERAEKIGMTIDSEIKESDYATLASVFKERISDITEKIIQEYTSSHPERSSKISLRISKDQLDAINKDGNLILNLYDMGIFSPDADNIRIVDFGVKYLKAHADGEVGYYGHVDIDMEHSGYSQFRKDGHVYWFDHSSRGTENPHTWRTSIDVNDLPEVIDPRTDQTSAANSSLLSSIIGGNTENIMMFSRPSAWSDIAISKQVVTNWGADIVIDSLVLLLQYDYTRRSSDITSIDVSANEDLTPYFVCSTEDLDGRSNGNGHLSRSYKKSSLNVSFKAAEKYETYYFKNWTDRSGKIVSDKADLTVNRSKDQFYIANYERRVPELSVPDTVWVSNVGGTYDVMVQNIGKGDTEMDWYVEDSLSTTPVAAKWLHLNGIIAEGVDNGSFTITCDVNKSGVDRVDSLEIFAPETDEMSKVIVVVQTNTQLKGDVNLDGQVGIGDIVAITNFMAGKPGNVTFERADVNGDGDVGIGDIVAVTNIMAGNSATARRR